MSLKRSCLSNGLLEIIFGFLVLKKQEKLNLNYVLVNYGFPANIYLYVSDIPGYIERF